MLDRKIGLFGVFGPLDYAQENPRPGVIKPPSIEGIQPHQTSFVFSASIDSNQSYCHMSNHLTLEKHMAYGFQKNMRPGSDLQTLGAGGEIENLLKQIKAWYKIEALLEVQLLVWNSKTSYLRSVSQLHWLPGNCQGHSRFIIYLFIYLLPGAWHCVF